MGNSQSSGGYGARQCLSGNERSSATSPIESGIEQHFQVDPVVTITLDIDLHDRDEVFVHFPSYDIHFN